MPNKSLFALSLSLLLFCGCVSLPVCAAEEPSRAPSSMLLRSDGSLVFTDVFNKALWQRKADLTYTRLAGRQGVLDAQGVPSGGYLDDKAETAAFQMPWAVTPYLEGYAVSDTENHALRYVADGKVSTIAGSGKAAFANGLGTSASFNRPSGLATMEDGSLLVADTENHQIRRVTTKGEVTTYAGGSEGCANGSLQSAKFRAPTGLFYRNGILYIADTGNHRICIVENGTVSTLAGSLEGTEGFVNGKAEKARFSSPQGVCSDGSSVYVADTGNGALRLIRAGRVSTLLQSEDATGLSLAEPRALALSGDTLYVGDIFARTIFTLELKKKSVTYQDVKQGDWFYDAAHQANDLGLMNGTGEGLFSPHDTVSRAMSITVLSRLERYAQPNSVIGGAAHFSDVPDSAYYASAASWGKAKGLIGGDGASFMPNNAVTRADWATILYRYAKNSGLTVNGTADLSVFQDKASIPVYATDAITWAYRAGILSGKGEGLLDPLGTLTRSELALMAQRYLSLI